MIRDFSSEMIRASSTSLREVRSWSVSTAPMVLPSWSFRRDAVQ